MKIFGLRVYTDRRIRRIVKLLEGSQQDAQIAGTLLIREKPKKEAGIYPQYKVVVESDKLDLMRKIGEDNDWTKINWYSYTFGDSDSYWAAMRNIKETKKRYAENDKRERNRKKFAKYEIEL